MNVCTGNRRGNRCSIKMTGWVSVIVTHRDRSARGIGGLYLKSSANKRGKTGLKTKNSRTGTNLKIAHGHGGHKHLEAVGVENSSGNASRSHRNGDLLG